jgi:hypothetical protein
MAKYPWGDEAVSMPIMGVVTVISALALGGVLARVGPADAVGAAYPAPTALYGVAQVTCVYMLMVYIFFGNQVGIKFSKNLPKDIGDKAAEIATRTVANTLEQAIPFLVLMWLEAIFVNPEVARIFGWIYVLTRFLYPLVYGAFGDFTVAVMLATQPNYIIIFHFLWTILYKCHTTVDLHAKIDAKSPWLVLVYMLVVSLSSFICFLLLAAPSTKLIVAGVKKDKGYVEPDDDEEE